MSTSNPTETFRPRSSSLSRRPTTPLRRLSASSLRSLSLSHSRSRAPTSLEPPLQHLAHVFAELADAMSDLAGNFEALAGVNDGLDSFGESLGAYLLGVRMNAYTADFDEAPTAMNFALSASLYPTPVYAPAPQSSSSSSSSDGGDIGDGTTFVTHDSEYSFVETPARGSLRGRGVGRGRGRGRGGKVVLTKRKRDEQLAFADAIIQQLPIKFREQQPQRTETETVITALRENSPGLSLPELTKQTSVPTHRINDALTALVRAKVALRVLAKGVTTYKLDPSKYPPV